MIEIKINHIKEYKRNRKSHSDYSFGGWYLIKNKVNNMCYIGKSIEPIERLKQHLYPSTSKTQIDKEINFFGENNFTFYVVDFYKKYGIDFFNRSLELKIEKNLIKKYNTFYPKGYNLK